MDYEPLTDAEWALVEELFQERGLSPKGHPRMSPRICVDAVLHVLTIKCGWNSRGLPKNLGYPSTLTVYRRYIEWRDSGVMAKAIERLTSTRGVFEERRPANNPDQRPKAPRPVHLFCGAEILESMQAAARARLLEGKPANWKCEADHVYA
jgi:transposase